MMADSKSILFVCTGNTCRSPMAEGLFRKAVEGRNDYEVGSSGVMAGNGAHASRETVAALHRRGVKLESFRSRLVTKEILDQATHVLAMTSNHLAHLEAMFPEFSEKYFLLGEFSPEARNSRMSHDIPDPIGMGPQAYEEVASAIEAAIPSLIAYADSGA